MFAGGHFNSQIFSSGLLCALLAVNSCWLRPAATTGAATSGVENSMNLSQPQDDRPVPNPELMPEQVIGIQLRVVAQTRERL